MGLTAGDRARCLAALSGLLQGCDGVLAAMLALRDGRPFAEKLNPGVESGRFAAMSSSLAALGHSVLRELKAGALDHVLIEGEQGKLVLCIVPETGGLMLLAVLAAPEARLGRVLGQARLCAQEVSTLLPRVATGAVER